MKRIAAAAIVTTLFALAPPATANHAAGWHWKRFANPFQVKVLASVTSNYNGPLAGATSDWSQSDKLNMVVVPGNTSLATRRRCAETSGQVHICNANYGAVGWAGLTELAVSGGHITRIRTRINDYYVTSRGLRRLVVCHELGHSIGLAHRSQSSSCMKQGTTNAHPDAHDYAELDAIYQHVDRRTPTTGKTETIKIYDWVSPQ